MQQVISKWYEFILVTSTIINVIEIGNLPCTVKVAVLLAMLSSFTAVQVYTPSSMRLAEVMVSIDIAA